MMVEQRAHWPSYGGIEKRIAQDFLKFVAHPFVERKREAHLSSRDHLGW
jgi:hypothetical protein